ncbi:hypothetical protein [Crateriforma spongiae]|uniref:hypothetical protein n=1 Tax=Crateriforma spongiae TaxID=2724528 RepID=UPI0039AEDA6C
MSQRHEDDLMMTKVMPRLSRKCHARRRPLARRRLAWLMTAAFTLAPSLGTSVAAHDGPTDRSCDVAKNPAALAAKSDLRPLPFSGKGGVMMFVLDESFEQTSCKPEQSRREADPTTLSIQDSLTFAASTLSARFGAGLQQIIEPLSLTAADSRDLIQDVRDFIAKYAPPVTDASIVAQDVAPEPADPFAPSDAEAKLRSQLDALAQYEPLDVGQPDDAAESASEQSVVSAPIDDAPFAGTGPFIVTLEQAPETESVAVAEADSPKDASPASDSPSESVGPVPFVDEIDGLAIFEPAIAGPERTIADLIAQQWHRPAPIKQEIAEEVAAAKEVAAAQPAEAPVTESYMPYDVAAKDLPIWGYQPLVTRPFCIRHRAVFDDFVTAPEPETTDDFVAAMPSTDTEVIGSGLAKPAPVAHTQPTTTPQQWITPIQGLADGLATVTGDAWNDYQDQQRSVASDVVLLSQYARQNWNLREISRGLVSASQVRADANIQLADALSDLPLQRPAVAPEFDPQQWKAVAELAIDWLNQLDQWGQRIATVPDTDGTLNR